MISRPTLPPVHKFNATVRKRFIDCFVVHCFECSEILPLNPDPDGYLRCLKCGAMHDTFASRSVTPAQQKYFAKLGPDGRLHRSKIPTGALVQRTLIDYEELSF